MQIKLNVKLEGFKQEAEYRPAEVGDWALLDGKPCIMQCSTIRDHLILTEEPLQYMTLKYSSEGYVYCKGDMSNLGNKSFVEADALKEALNLISVNIEDWGDEHERAVSRLKRLL